ncbi:MAG: DUF3108 domain-containing protein [Gammaproteobacteria bacterium]|nr:DUF3108 domain-containing protein [Gammaproteobacteria bacterium]
MPLISQAGLLQTGFNAKYELSLKSMYVGIATRQLTVEDKQLTFTSVAEPRGLARLFVSDTISESSAMTFNGQSIQPLNYRYQQNGGKKIINDSVTFNSKEKLIQFTHDQQQFPITINDYDALNFQLALMLELQQHHDNFTFNVASYRKFYSYNIKVLGTETIDTPAGEFDVVKVDSIHPESGRRFLFWCAPKLDYLPVKVEYTKEKDGDVSELILQSLIK